jgi:hypothetical protein
MDSHSFFHILRARKVGLQRAQSGQAIVLIALMMVSLMGITGLALDGGSLLLLQRRAQKVADIAAMSAAVARCQGTGDPEAAARTVAIANDVNANDPEQFKVEFPNDTDIAVTVKLPKTPYFIQLVYRGPLIAQGYSKMRCSIADSAYNGAVLVATSTTCPDTLHVNGSDLNFEGSFWSNNEVFIGTSDTTISGGVEYLGGDLPYGDGNGWYHTSVGGNGPRDTPNAGNAISQKSNQAPLPPINIADYRPGGRAALAAEAAGLYTVGLPSGAYLYTGPGIDTSRGSLWYQHRTHDGSSDLPTRGLFYVPGDLGGSVGSFLPEGEPVQDRGMYVIPGGADDPGLTIVVEGRINLSGNGFRFNKPYIDGLTIFSNQNMDADGKVIPGHCRDQVIMTGSRNTQFQGLIYAPGGRVLVSMSDVDTPIYGQIIANEIEVDVSHADIRFQSSIVPPDDPTIYYAE